MKIPQNAGTIIPLFAIDTFMAHAQVSPMLRLPVILATFKGIFLVPSQVFSVSKPKTPPS